MKQQLGKKFWLTLVIFSLMGQVAWVVENMYFNVFIYKMFHATASDISLMVGASAIAATLTTWLIGAFSDRIGKRKILICGGYIVWGISILSFAFIRMDILTPIAGSTTAAASLGVTLVIIMDCVMTFFGSSANDAAFNAWLTDMGDETNRGKIEGINSMMPLVGILVVFGGFMAFDLDSSKSWVTIYTIIGVAVIIIGVLGFFLIKDAVVPPDKKRTYLENVLYSFRPSVMKNNQLLYAVVGVFSIFGISIQIFMPYLILYYEKSLGMENYVLVMAPAIILAAVITSFYGKLYDRLGFQKSVVPTILFLMGGYTFLFFFTNVVPVFIGSLLMMTGYLTGMAIFGAMIRDHMPEDKAGLFQGLRIFGQVFIPGIVGPAIGARVLRNAQEIVNSDGTTSFLPNRGIFLAAFLAALAVLIALYLVFLMIRRGHHKLGPKDTSLDWTSYPRPQMKRDSFLSLNGSWKANGQTVQVPYPLQSYLSGYQGRVPSRITYEKQFALPENFRKDNQRVLLHFGAVDTIAGVTLNQHSYPLHQGGYLPFTIDITEQVITNGDNELTVMVKDSTGTRYPYGKQTKRRGGMWYTPVSGIWQTVWLEAVEEHGICDIQITPDLQGIQLKVDAPAVEKVQVTIYQGEIIGEHTAFAREHIIFQDTVPKTGYIALPSEEIKIWDCQHPFLYSMTVETDQDRVDTYFALREIAIRKIGNYERFCLNGQPIFLNGVLDQGYYCDGIFLPGNEKEYDRDILRMKSLGYNILRKHIKVEPEYFYNACDRLGMLVMQDMVNNGRYRFIRDTVLPTLGKMDYDDTRRIRSAKGKEIFLEHTKDTIRQLYNHPCIIAYTIFNEGWGQFDSDKAYTMVKELDSTRIIDSTSGWFAQKKSDVDSLHIYFRNERVKAQQRPAFISECGGYTYMIPGHFYSKYAMYGYGNYKNETELTDAVIQMYQEMVLPSISEGLCGCIYTQLSDVEDETNGIYTYDRQICKVEEERLRAVNEKILEAMMIVF